MMASMVPERILLVRTGGLGDTLLLWPAVVAVRRRFSQARISLMGNKGRCELLVGAEGADEALAVDGSGYHHFFEGEPPPALVCERFQNYHVVVAFASPGDCTLAEGLSACGVREVHAFLPFPPTGDRAHMADYMERVLYEVDLASAGDTPLLPVPAAEQDRARSRLTRYGLEEKKFALLAPGSGSPNKNWSPNGFAEIFRRLQRSPLRPAILQGPADSAAVLPLLSSLSGLHPLVLADESESDLRGLLSLAALFVGNDSGPAHLSALIGVPTLAVFGPTDPTVWGPRGRAVRIVKPTLPCVPCSSSTLNACLTRSCLSAENLERVWTACRELVVV